MLTRRQFSSYDQKREMLAASVQIPILTDKTSVLMLIVYVAKLLPSALYWCHLWNC